MTTQLPKDDQTILILNCARSWQEVEREHVYICPSEGANYKYKPCRYFGAYHDLKVSPVANIEAVIDVFADDTTTIRWVGGGGKEADYQQKAVTFANRLRPKTDFPLQVFILGYPQATDFKKGSRSGMQGSKQYLDVSSLGVDTAGYLAPKLNGKKWSDFHSVERSTNRESTGSPDMYEPLKQWFISREPENKQVSLAFQQIEIIISASLPPSAREYSAWWLDKTPNTKHTQASAWLEAGWLVDNLELENERVSFMRSV